MWIDSKISVFKDMYHNRCYKIHISSFVLMCHLPIYHTHKFLFALHPTGENLIITVRGFKFVICIFCLVKFYLVY